MKQSKIILNFDETIIKMTTAKHFSWCKRGQSNQRIFGKPISGLSLLVAVSSEGDIFYKYLDGNNNSATVASFFVSLADQLSLIDNDWRQKIVVVLDNCASHKTKLVRQILWKLRFPVLYTAPASYLCLPVELLFAAIKSHDYSEIETPILPIVQIKKITKLSNKQRAMLKISNYLRSIPCTSIKRIFYKQLINLTHFLTLSKV